MPLTVAQLVARLTADTSGFYRGMAVANSAMLRTGGIITRIATGAGLAVGAIGVLSIQAAGNFEQSMNLLQATTGATDAKLKQMQDTALGLGRDFKLPAVSAKDAADAMVELSKGGLTVRQTMDAARGSLQLGTAANISYTEAAQFTARSLKAFSLEGDQAGRVANVLAAAANKSTAEFSDLTYGFQNASSQFHSTGMSVEDLAASLAIMADSGISGEQAGTALKTMLIRLTSPTNAASEVMKKYGIDIFDAAGEMKSMPNIIGQFQSALGPLTTEQREQALTTLFGVRANSAMRILMKEGSQGYREYRDAVTGTTAAQQLAEARTKGFNGALQAIGSAVQTAAVELGLSMLPALTKAGFAIANFIASIDVSKIIDFASKIKDIVVAVVDFVSHSEILKGAILGLIAGFAGFLVINAIIGLVAALGAAFVALGAAMLANPVVLVAAALIGLGVAAIYAYKHSETFRNIVNAAFAAVKAASAWVVDAAREIGASFQRMWSEVKPTVDAIRTAVEVAWRVIQAITKAVWPVISAILKAEWEIMKAVVTAALNVIKAIIQTIGAALRGDWQGVWNGMKAILSAALNGMVNILQAILTGMVSVATAYATMVGKAIWTGLKAGAAALSQLAGWLGSRIGSAISSAAGMAAGAAVAIGSAIVQGVLSGISGLAASVGQKIASEVSGAIAWAKGHVGSTADEATEKEIGKPLAVGIIRGFLLGIVDLPEKMKDKLRAALEAGAKVVQAGLDKMKTQFSQFTSDALSAFDAITQKHKTPAEIFLEKIQRERKEKEIADAITKGIGDVDAARAAYDALISTGASPEAIAEAKAKLEAATDELTKAYQDKWVYAAELQAEKERLQYEARREQQKRHLQAQLEDLQAFLEKHPEEHNKVQQKVIALLKSYGVSYKQAGAAMGTAFASGMISSMNAIEHAAEEIAKVIRKYLKLKSPAEKGPLSDLDHWWDNFGSTLVSGLDSGSVENALSSLVSPLGTSTSLGALGGASNTLGAAPVIVNLHVQGNVWQTEELVSAVRLGLTEGAKRGEVIPGIGGT